MTARDHWQRVYAASMPGGALDVLDKVLTGLIPALISVSFLPGLEYFGRLAGLCGEMQRSIDSAIRLSRLGCPESTKHGIVLNPMENPYADPR